jgi:hypothetical protein
MTDKQTVTDLKADFLIWSGGFPPDSPEQVTVYMDYAISVDVDPDFARQTLLDWMERGGTEFADDRPGSVS